MSGWTERGFYTRVAINDSNNNNTNRNMSRSKFVWRTQSIYCCEFFK